MRIFPITLAIALLPVIVHARPSLDKRLNEGGIIKEITIPEGQNFAYVDVEAVIDAPPGAVWSTLCDIDRWPRWLPFSRTGHFLSPEAAAKITKDVARARDKVIAIDRSLPPAAADPKFEGRWQRMAYEEYDLPWPLKDEWVVRNYTFGESEGMRRASWKKVDSQDDKDDGFWEIRPWSDGKKTDLRYYYRVKTKEGVPRPVFRTAVAFTVNSMIKALRHEAARIIRTAR